VRRHCLLRCAPLVTSLAVPAYELGSFKCGVPGDGGEFSEVEIIGEWNLVADTYTQVLFLLFFPISSLVLSLKSQDDYRARQCALYTSSNGHAIPRHSDGR
jgi:hypothetical protein